MTVKTIQLEKIFVSDIEIVGLFVEKLTADDKYSLLNRNNLLQRLQMQLCQKEKKRLPNFFCVLEI